MAAAVARTSAAKAQCFTWKQRLESTLGTLESAAEAVTRLTAGALQAADVLSGRDTEVSASACVHHAVGRLVGHQRSHGGCAGNDCP